jgi:hypothetical protein
MMRQRILMFSLIAILSAVIGVGYAGSGKPNDPKGAPDPFAPTAVATKHGVLKCKGKVAKIKLEDLPGRKLAAHPDVAEDAPELSDFACAKDKAGKETGDVAVKAKKKDGTTTLETIPTE